MATWHDFIVTAKNRNLIRKSKDGVVLQAPMTATLPTTILAGGDLLIPTDFKPVGWHTEDGMAWAREVENSELGAHGSVDPVRTDPRRVNNTLELTAMETNIRTLGNTYGLELDPASGTANELTFTESTNPQAREHRWLALSMDDTEYGEIYFGKMFAAGKVTGSAPAAWANGDAAQGYGLTVTAFRDVTAGWAVKHFIGGPGFTGLREAMGFDEITGP